MQDLYPNLTLLSNSFEPLRPMANLTSWSDDMSCSAINPTKPMAEALGSSVCMQTQPKAYRSGALCQFTDCYLERRRASCKFPFR